MSTKFIRIKEGVGPLSNIAKKTLSVRIIANEKGKQKMKVYKIHRCPLKTFFRRIFQETGGLGS